MALMKMICPPSSWFQHGPGRNTTENPIELNQMHEYLGTICDDHHLDRDETVTEKGFKHQFSFFVIGLGGSLVCFFGLMINLLALFHMRGYRSKIKEKVVYVMALSIWDCLLLINSWVSLCLAVLVGKGHISTSGLFVNSYGYIQALMHICITGVTWMTLVTTVERYITVCWQNLTNKIREGLCRAVTIVSMTALAVVAFNICRFFEIEIEYCCNFQEAKVVPQAKRAAFALPTRPYYLWYRIVGKSLCVTIIPFLILSVLTHKIIQKIKEWDWMYATSEPSESHSAVVPAKPAQSESLMGNNAHPNSVPAVKAPRRQGFRVQKQLSRTLSFVLVKFLVCHSLTVVNDILEFLLFDSKQLTMATDTWYFSYLIDVANFLVMLHSASTGAFFLALSRRVELRRSRHTVVQPEENSGDDADYIELRN